MFPRTNDQNAAESVPAERVGPGGGAVHAAHHLQLFSESAQQDVRHDPVLAESDPVLALLSLVPQAAVEIDTQMWMFVERDAQERPRDCICR